MNTPTDDLHEIREWVKANHPELDETSVNHSASLVNERFDYVAHLRDFDKFMNSTSRTTRGYREFLASLVGRFEARYSVSYGGRHYKRLTTAVRKLMEQKGLTAEEAERRVIVDFVRVEG